MKLNRRQTKIERRAPRMRAIGVGAPFAAALLFLLIPAAPHRAAAQTTGQITQTAGEIIGRVEGADFTIDVPAGAQPAVGQTANLLVAGSHLNVSSGQAKISLDGGGEIDVCGPARLQLLKSNGAITIALEFGMVHLHMDSRTPVSIFTPMVMATPVAVGAGGRDVTIGLEHDSRMCLRSSEGALRVEQQLGGQSLLVPEAGGLSMNEGQLSPVVANAPGCGCDSDAARNLQPQSLSLTPAHITQSIAQAVAAPANAPYRLQSNETVGRPIVPRAPILAIGPVMEIAGPPAQVVAPALVFNATGIEPPPDPNPEIIYMARALTIRDETVFRDTVQPAANSKGATLTAQANAPQPKQGFFSRLFHKLFGS
jgi:hypothetical protein